MTYVFITWAFGKMFILPGHGSYFPQYALKNTKEAHNEKSMENSICCAISFLAVPGTHCRNSKRFKMSENKQTCFCFISGISLIFAKGRSSVAKTIKFYITQNTLWGNQQVIF